MAKFRLALLEWKAGLSFRSIILYQDSHRDFIDLRNCRLDYHNQRYIDDARENRGMEVRGAAVRQGAAAAALQGTAAAAAEEEEAEAEAEGVPSRGCVIDGEGLIGVNLKGPIILLRMEKIGLLKV